MTSNAIADAVAAADRLPTDAPYLDRLRAAYGVAKAHRASVMLDVLPVVHGRLDARAGFPRRLLAAHLAERYDRGYAWP